MTGPGDIVAPPVETLDEFYDHAPCGYLTTNAAGHMVRANATLLGWLGLTREDMLGRPAPAILTQTARSLFAIHVEPHLAEGAGAQRIALELAGAGDLRIPVLTDWRCMFVDGMFAGVRVVFLDATDHAAPIAEGDPFAKRAERLIGAAAVADIAAQLERSHEQLRQTRKLEAVGNLTSGVAHDFNNLLSPIIGGLDTLQRRGFGDARARAVIGNALEAAERARVLVQRLLAFARRQPVLPIAVDIAALLRDIAPLVRTTVGPRIALRIDAAADLPFVLADANQIEMAILNMAVNARDAMPDGGMLSIAATVDPGDGAEPARITLDVTDTGHGMDAVTLERAVEPFFSTKAPDRGTGLGLSMVHDLVMQLGGRLSLRSAPGAGTSIILQLPVAPDGAGGRSDRMLLDIVAERQRTILLVDDEPLVRASTAEMLSDLGYRVVEAEGGQSALQMIVDGLLPDALLTDHLMPGMTGCELAEEICADRSIPVLILSGLTAEEDGGLPFPRLDKPFRHRDLAAALDRLPPMGLVGQAIPAR